MMRFPSLLSLALLAAAPALARDPILNPPIDCDLSGACFIPRYVDVDPSAGASDFRCGPLTGDGHKGTDFAIPSRAAMEAGVPVHPAAPGTVLRIRDGVPDMELTAETRAQVEGVECGNGVVIDHGGGWETQYCHLRNGSIRVRPGQRVGNGTMLGEVGLSGQTTFPHVHLSVRHDGRVIDPFAPEAQAECGPPEGDDLWQTTPPYRPGGLISVGFWAGVPSYDEVRAGTARAETLRGDDQAMVIWGYAFGGRPGDRMRLSILGPDGPVIDKDVTIDSDQALFFRAVGRRTPEKGWPGGTYLGRVQMVRDGVTLESRETQVSVTP